MTEALSIRALEDFPAAFKGPCFPPSDAAYAELKPLWNTRRGDGWRPALVAQPLDVDDVVTAVRYAAENDVTIGVRSGGHGIDGLAMPHDALVIDMSRMKNISVDPDSGRTTIESGVLLGELDAATQEHGYVVPAGTVSDTGAAGLTLGGGIGHLTRRFGATVDNLLSIDLVTTDGRVLTASAEENPELFWGMRGAGHNLAIATSFTFRAHRLGPDVMSGSLVFSGDDAVNIFSGIDEAVAATPRELSMTPAMLAAPPLPGLPPELIGTPVVLLLVIYTGPAEEFEAAFAPIRALATPIAGGVGPSTWVQTNSMIDQMSPPGRRQHSGGGYLPALTAEVAEIVKARVAAAPAPTSMAPSCLITFPMLGGALHDLPEDSAAFSRVGAQWLCEVVGQWDGPAADEQFAGWVDESTSAIEPHFSTSAYINLTADRGAAWLRTAYGSPEKWERIVALKRTWDPHNRLLHNKNVLKAAQSL